MGEEADPWLPYKKQVLVDLLNRYPLVASQTKLRCQMGIEGGERKLGGEDFEKLLELYGICCRIQGASGVIDGTGFQKIATDFESNANNLESLLLKIFAGSRT